MIMDLSSCFSLFLSSFSCFTLDSSIFNYYFSFYSFYSLFSHLQTNSLHLSFIILHSYTASFSQVCNRQFFILSFQHWLLSSLCLTVVSTMRFQCSLSYFSKSLILLSFICSDFSTFSLFLLEVSSCSCRQVQLVVEQLFLTRGVAVSSPLLSSTNGFFFLLLLNRFMLYISGQMKAHKILLFVLITLLILGQAQHSKSQIKNICRNISVKLDNFNSKLKTLTNQLNELQLKGQVDFKEAHKSKSKEVIALSNMIESLAKSIQKIYDDQSYLKFCVLLEEEAKYNQTQQEEQLRKGFQQLQLLNNEVINYKPKGERDTNNQL